MSKSLWTIIILLAFGILGCAGIREKPETLPVNKHGIVVPPLKYVSPEDKKHWEGEINGRIITCFKLVKESGVSNVVISTEDKLPEYFKRIEYLDIDGDRSLDLMSMRIYTKEKGWKDVGITRENKYGLAYADSQYKDLLVKMEEAGIDLSLP